MAFLKSSTFLSKLHSLQTCQLLFLRIFNAGLYATEYIFPPQEGHGIGMSTFMIPFCKF